MPFPNHDPSTTFAVFRATPGRVSSLSISSGTWPPKFSTIALDAPTTDLALLRKKPVGRRSGSSCSGLAAAMAWGVGYLWNSPGVTLLTITSVHWADKIVAISSSQALLWCSAQRTLG